MTHSTKTIFASIFIIALIAIGMLTFVQAQTTPTAPGGITLSQEYYDLTVNIPLVSKIIASDIPIFKKGSNIKEALLITADGAENTGFLAMKSDDPYGLFLITSDAPDASEAGEIYVYKYGPKKVGERMFSSWDCGKWGSSETKDIRSEVRALTSINVDEFLTKFGCESDSFSFSGPTQDELISNMKVLSSAIRQKYSGQDVFITPSAAITMPVTPAPVAGGANTITAAVPVVQACKPAKIVKYTDGTDVLLSKGKLGFSLGGNTPIEVSDDPLSIANEDNRLPISIIFKDKETKASLYMLTISKFSWEGDGELLNLQTQLCYNDSGVWKEGWSQVGYSIFEGGKFKRAASGLPSTELQTKVADRSNNTEISARFTGGDRDKVSLFFYLNEDEKTIYYIAMDAQKEFESVNYRFDIDKATYEILVKEIPEYANMTPDMLRKELQKIMMFKGQKNLVNNNYSGSSTTTNMIKAVKAEGALNDTGEYDNSYFKIIKMKVPGDGEYEFSLALPGYRIIKKPITLKSSDLSADEADRVSWDDIKSISITRNDLKKDRCSSATTLELGLLCVDTAFVDAIISSK